MISDIIKQDAAIVRTVKSVLDQTGSGEYSNIRLVIHFDKKNEQDWENLVCSLLTEFAHQNYQDSPLSHFCEFILIGPSFKNEKCISTNTRYFNNVKTFFEFANQSFLQSKTLGVIVSFGQLDNVETAPYLYFSITEDEPLTISQYEPFDFPSLISSY